MSTPPSAPEAGFVATDLQLLAAIRQQDLGLRAVLCTLARHGVALRRDQPERATAWLDELAPHPLFKGGQFLFDLLEWEDFMLHGDAVPPLDGAALQLALERLRAVLCAISAGSSAQVPEPKPAPGDIRGSGAGRELPALQSSFYLYHDVVLGALALLAPLSGP